MLQRRCLFSLLVGLLVVTSSGGALAQAPAPGALSVPATLVGPGFTYQGKLTNGSGPVTATCSFQFSLWDAAGSGTPPTGGTQIGATQAVPNVSVAAGSFAVTLNDLGQFGAGAFTGQARWLAVAVECPPDVSFTTLSPRQPLSAVPYALYALSAGTALSATTATTAPYSGLTGMPTPLHDLASPAACTNAQVPTWTGATWTCATVSGSLVYTAGAGLVLTGTTFALNPSYTDGRYWKLSGNTGTTANNFLGTTDNMTLTLAVSGTAALRLVPNDTSPNVIGGSINNTVSGGAVGATIGGGGGASFPNTVSGSYATVGGGLNNTASGGNAAMGGGYSNTASNGDAVVGGGQYNAASGTYATVGGGDSNRASADGAAVGGGGYNHADGSYAAVGGGFTNKASGIGATVGGGGYDGVTTAGNLAGGKASTIAGGIGNVITTTASYATVGGGTGNLANGQGATVGGGGYDGSNFVSNQAAGKASTIGGGMGNVVSGDGATVGGGGTDGTEYSGNVAGGVASTIGGGLSNGILIGGSYATIGGGLFNGATNNVATVGGGDNNHADGSMATVGGGYGNTASGGGATVGGGGTTDGINFSGNTAAGNASTIGGGFGNAITTTGTFATVGGGYGNAASNNVATVGGGDANVASGAGATVGGGGNDGTTAAGNVAGGNASTIGGGLGNTINRAADYATVPGGLNNTANGYASLAAGDQAKALAAGDFVWSDASGSPLTSTVPNQFLVRASGGITLYTDSGETSGTSLYPGSGGWNILSDRNLKANFSTVDGLQVLNALAGIPVQTWNYKTQAATIRHMGPMAQDFKAAFGVGENDTTISTVDAQGVALAAIQGLYTVVQQKDAQISALRDTGASQQVQIAALNARVTSLESRSTAPAGQSAPGTNILQLLVVLLVGVVAGGGLCLGAFALGRRGVPVNAPTGAGEQR